MFLEPRAHEQNTSYVLIQKSLEVAESQGACLMNLGANAGLKNDANSGLAKFKRKWSTKTCTSYFCGKILDKHLYETLSRKHVSKVEFFPQYRAPDAG